MRRSRGSLIKKFAGCAGDGELRVAFATFADKGNRRTGSSLGYEGVMSSGPVTSGGCLHENTSRRGSNAYVEMDTCKDCGIVLKKER